MTEKTKDDIAPVEGEELAVPTPTISAGSDQAGSEESRFDAEAFEKRFFEKLVPTLDELVDKRVKSIKDRRLNKLAKIDEILEAVEASGGDPNKIRDSLEKEEILSRMERLEQFIGGAGGSAASGKTQVSQAEFDKRTADILEEAGIPLDDPEVVELSKSPVANEAEWYRKLTRLGVKRAKQGGIGGAAVVGSSGKAPSKMSSDEIFSEIERLQVNPVANAARIKELMDQAKESGYFD